MQMLVIALSQSVTPSQVSANCRRTLAGPWLRRERSVPRSRTYLDTTSHANSDLRADLSCQVP